MAVDECVAVADWGQGPALEEVVDVDDGLDADDGHACGAEEALHFAAVVLRFDALWVGGDRHACVEDDEFDACFYGGVGDIFGGLDDGLGFIEGGGG